MPVKKVRYIGCEELIPDCDDPKDLEVGQVYQVVIEDIMTSQERRYTLWNMPKKQFSARWFEDVPDAP